VPGKSAGPGILKFVVHRWIVVVCVSLVFDHSRFEAFFRESRFGDTGDAGSSPAEQAARANADICHAACDLMSSDLKLRSLDRDHARGAPDAVVAHL
jgi:hypothetical protein